MGEPQSKTPRSRGRPFQKGQSGNPAGRPKGSAGFAAMLRQETDDGKVLVAKAIKIAKNDKHRNQLEAIAWCSDRMLGRVPHAVGVGTPEEIEKWRAAAEQLEPLEKMSEAELEAQLADKLRARGFTVTRNEE